MILVLAEHVGGELRAVTREAVSAAVELAAGPVVVAVVGAEGLGAALEGVDEVVRVAAPAGPPTSETYRQAVAALVRERRPRAVLAGFTVDGMGFGPAAAAELGLAFASDVLGLALDGETLVARRELFGGRVAAEVELPGETALVLLRPTSWPEAADGGAPAESRVELAGGPARVRHREYVQPPPAAFDIAAAPAILAVGRGIGERENVSRFEQLAERLGVALGASRPLVDAGWLPAERQVGQSGRTVKPRLYVALGISGAVQHLAGMKAAGTIVAVNTDPEAPIFNVAHYGAVADVLDVAEELEKLL